MTEEKHATPISMENLYLINWQLNNILFYTHNKK